MRINHLLNATAEVWRFSRVPDGMGGYAESWAKVGDTRARFSQPSARERTIADKEEARLTHVAYLAAGSDVRRRDELRTPGRTYEVLAVFEPSVPGTYLRADCRSDQPGE